MKIVNIRQGTPQWLAWRDEGVSASDIAVILGRSPYKSPWRLWAEKAGKVAPEDLSGNMFVRHGKRSEPVVRRYFEQKYETMLLPVCGESSENPLIRASFDGLSDDGVPVELKAPSDSVFDEVVALRESSSAYQLYYPQVQTQIYVSGADHGYLVFGRVGQCEDGTMAVGEAVEFRIARDDEFLADMVQKAEAFVTSVKDKKEPPKDPARDLYVPQSDQDRGAWEAAAAVYKAREADIAVLKQQLAKLKQEQEAAETHLLTLMGQFAMANHAGIGITRYVQKGPVNYTSFLKDRQVTVSDTELDQYRSAPSTRTKVTILQATEAAGQNAAATPAAA